MIPQVENSNEFKISVPESPMDEKKLQLGESFYSENDCIKMIDISERDAQFNVG